MNTEPLNNNNNNNTLHYCRWRCHQAGRGQATLV